ncbi:MAG: protein kinase [Eubacteriales bacterium]
MVGNILKKRYRIEKKFDSGGMSDLYTATDLKTNEIVCLKILKSELTIKRGYLLRFNREARASMALKHRNIIRTLDYGNENGIHFIVMEYFNGKTLAEKIKKEGPLPIKEVLGIAACICSGLEYAHSKGLIHRDVKPRNILINEKGNVRIIDFGIAKNLSAETVTLGEKDLIGSVYYFSPEQAKGMPVDQRSDIYSFGIVLYEMLTGKTPFSGDNAVSVAIKHINEELPKPNTIRNELPISVNNIILKATQKDRKHRYSSFADMRTDILKAIARPDENSVKLKKSIINKRKLGAILVAPVIIVGFLIGMFVYRGLGSTKLPALTGLTETQAVEICTNLGLKVDKTYEYNSSINDTYIISQDPGEGAYVDEGQVVYLKISLGQEPSQAPSVIGMSEEEAIETLLASGFVDVEVAYTEGEPVGYVKLQEPIAGESIQEDSIARITVYGSETTESVIMDNIIGMAEDKAVAKLQSSGFTGAYIYMEESKSAANTIINQQPVEGVNQALAELPILWESSDEAEAVSALTTFKFTIDDASADVTICYNEMVNGFEKRYILYEGEYKKGDIVLPLNLKSYGEGEKTLVIYANGNQISNKQVKFSK